MKLKFTSFKTLYSYCTKPVKHKFHEFQIMRNWSPSLMILVDIDFHQRMGNVFSVELNLFDLVAIHCYKDEEQDHAGLTFNLKVFGFELDYNHRDQRHWDYDNDKWEE